jgi:hypothetical protein
MGVLTHSEAKANSDMEIFKFTTLHNENQKQSPILKILTCSSGKT